MARTTVKSFPIYNKNHCGNPLTQLYSLQREALVTTDVSEKTISGVLVQEEYPVICVSSKLSPAQQNDSNI